MNATAPRDGMCAKCGETIAVGDQIAPYRSEMGLIHARCVAKRHRQGAQPVKPTLDGEAQAAIDLIADVVAKRVRPAIDVDEVRAIVDKAVAQALVDRTVSVKVERRDVPDVTIDNAHPMMATLLTVMAAGQHCYLWGLPGSGKDTAARLCAEGLGRPFGMLSGHPQATAVKLEGFVDAQGRFAAPEFYRIAVEGGGVFCLSEADNLSPALAMAMNTALANGHAAFASGTFPLHRDFTVIVNGNTAMRGGSRDHAHRSVQDRAFRDRFLFLKWDYCAAHERQIARGINAEAAAWVRWVHALRAWAATNNPEIDATPRAVYQGASLLLISIKKGGQRHDEP